MLRSLIARVIRVNADAELVSEEHEGPPDLTALDETALLDAYS
jgi:hypothetical protein